MTFFLIAVTILYFILILALIYGWRQIPEFQLKQIPPEIRFSVVVPFRNEAENLPFLLNSFTNLSYPASHFELILVDDASEDASIEICSDFIKDHPELQIFLLENVRISKAPKKDAFSTAIKNAQFDHIITTDADCLVPENWLQAFNEKIKESGAKLVAGPVKPFSGSADPEKYEERGLKYFHAFQEMDFLSLQAAGAGGFGLDKAFMCNGANLCYEKSAFIEAGGFTGNDNISSGDDVFLLQKFTENHWKTAFLKCREAIVLTKPQPDLSSLISQRIRWAAKAPAYKSRFAKLVGLVVLLMNFSLIIGLVLVLFDLIAYRPLIVAFLLKFNVDLILLSQSANFFNRKEILRNFFWSSLVYPFFSTYVAILSLFRGFEWKGRRFGR